MKNLGYLECQKGGYHTGQFLNIICLQSCCRNNMLCCCACIQQFHANHRTKTLKKLLMQADNLSKNYKQPSKKQQAKTRNCNTDIMSNIVANDQKQTISRFLQLKKQFITQIDKLQHTIVNYYKSLQNEINKPEEQVKDLKVLLLQNMELVQGSSNVQSLKNNVIKLIRSIQITQKSVGKAQLIQKPDQQSYLNFLRNSNEEITDIVQKKFTDLYKKLKNQSQKLNKVVPRIDSFWNNQLFKFSNIMHHPEVDVINPFLVRANVDSIYQVAVMNPHLTFSNQIETFKFRINVTDLQWVAVGVCYKNIVEKSNFEFKFNDLGHGCYLISGNAGTWSHSDPDFNNVVKGFYFKQGDSITCAVFKDRICFIKDVPPEHQFSEQYSQREYFQLVIKTQGNDQLHPCVVSYYKNTEVEYLPSFGSQLTMADMPVFNYKFSNKWKHHNSIILNDTHIYGCQPTQYKACLLDTPIQVAENSKQPNSITFRITRSTGTWIGLGLCHKNIVVANGYDFIFDTVGHGCYMISANGGTWSHIDVDSNNIVRTFKIVQGDLVTISLDQKNKKINFKRSVDKYQLRYEPIEGDLLYPVVVLYYPDDQVEVLPNF